MYVMRFIEQLFDDEKLRLPQTNVPYLRLKYVACILMEGSTAGISEKGNTSTGGKKELTLFVVL